MGFLGGVIVRRHPRRRTSAVETQEIGELFIFSGEKSHANYFNDKTGGIVALLSAVDGA